MASSVSGVRYGGKNAEGPMYGGDIRSVVNYLESVKGSLRSGRAFGDFRPELRAWLREAGAEVDNTFRRAPGWSVKPESVNRRLVRWNNPSPPGTDVWHPTLATTAQAYRHNINPYGHRGKRYTGSRQDWEVLQELRKNRMRMRHSGQAQSGYRGLRGAASNVNDKNTMFGTSLIRVAKLSADFGVNSSEDGIPYAKHLQKKWGFMNMTPATRAYLGELVLQGLEARLQGQYDYTGRSRSGVRYQDE